MRQPNDHSGLKRPAFEALSYAWGEFQEPVPIRVHERCKKFQPTTSSLHIQPSLELALRHLRLEKSKRKVWIDAICINQVDTIEKSLHIPYMWTIYKYASRTIVWLGPERNNSGLAMQNLKHIARQSVLLMDGSRLPAPGNCDLDIYQDPYPLLSEKSTEAITQLLDRQYFQRLWIISELSMSDIKAELHCGTDSMSLVDFRTSLKCLSSSPTRPPLALLKRLRDIKALTSPSSSLAFSVMLELYRHHKCADALDKVYGLLSMASKEFKECVDVDYKISCASLYQAVFLATVKFFERLDLLQACRLDFALENRSSWVPDLSRSYKYWRPLEYCSGCSEPDFSVISGQILRVSGVKCCTIKRISAKFTLDGHVRSNLLASLASISEERSTYPTLESLQDVFCRTICLDRTDQRYPGASNMENKFKMGELKALVKRSALESQDISNDSDESLLSQLASLLDGRDFFETPCGHFGLGPGISEEGTKTTNLELAGKQWLTSG
jgi:hypothetical protein